MSSINLLEKNIEKILELAGFNPELRVQLEGYEIDVLLEYETIQAIFECKQYEKSSLTVRNLIHEWSGKNEEIGADKVILVLVGINISEEDYKLAEKRDIRIWEGEKVDKLLDEVTEEHDNIKERILSEAGLESTEEIEKKIEEIQNDYNVARSRAKKYLRGEISKERLENYSEMNRKLDDEILEVLNETEKERYANGTEYYQSTIEKIDFMHEHQIYDKGVAEVFIKYSINSKEKIDFIKEHQIYEKDLAEELVKYSDEKLDILRTISKNKNCEITEANDFLKRIIEEDGKKEDFNTAGEIPNERFLNQLLDALNERDDLELEDAKELIKLGYTCTQLRQREYPVEAHTEKMSTEKFTVLGPYEGNSNKYSHLVACPECGAKRGIDVSLIDNNTIQCSNCNNWNYVRNIELYSSDQAEDSDKECFELKSEYLLDSKSSTYISICPNCGEEGVVDLEEKGDGDSDECWNCKASFPLDVPSGLDETGDVSRNVLIERIRELF